MAETMNGLKRTSYCGKLSKANVGNSEVVCGWVQKQRDKGHLIFIDLRDRTGVVQLVFDDDTNREVFEKAASVHAEYVLIAKGLVRQREAVNTEISTGEIEIHVDELRILSKAQTPPFEITDKSKVKEELRLKYRYLDLRRKTLQEKMILRHQVAKVTRDYFYENDFLEIETPMLIKSTPEGARDYLVPSRIHHGKFYALPQSPQIYKQLLMLSGFDRYIQLARCFRDEDLRADRQPEFTQVDLEMSFVTQEDIMDMLEGYIQRLYREIKGIEIGKMPRLTYREAMERYGSDKPDTRFEMEIVNLSEQVKGTSFPVFADALANSRNPVCYNGDLRTVGEVRALEGRFPEVTHVMIGRGLVADPALARKLRGGKGTDREELTDFLAALYQGYTDFYQGQVPTAAQRMREVWFYLIHLFDDAEKLNKQLRRFRTPAEYERIQAEILASCPIRSNVQGDLI